MTDLAQETSPRTPSEPGHSRDPEGWRAGANPELDYSGGSGGQEDPPPDPDHDMPVDPPPEADQDYSGGSGGEETDPPSGDADMPGDPPPPDVAENNGR